MVAGSYGNVFHLVGAILFPAWIISIHIMKIDFFFIIMKIDFSETLTLFWRVDATAKLHELEYHTLGYCHDFNDIFTCPSILQIILEIKYKLCTSHVDAI